MNRPVALLALVIGCGGKPADSGGTSLPSAGTTTLPSTGTVGTTVALSAACGLDADNALRVTCTAELQAPGTAIAQLSAAGAPTRLFTSTGAGTQVDLFAWGLKPDTDYSWDIGGITGTVRTGQLPLALGAATIDVSGSITGFDAVLLPMVCGSPYFTMIDEDGDIVWYEQNDLYLNGMDAYEWSQADRSLLIGNDGTVVEIGVNGDVLLELTGYVGRAHHDLARWGEYTYVLHDYQVGNLNVDGIHIFQGNALIDTLNLEDQFTVSGPGGDWSHCNGINPTPDGHLILSSLVFDSVLSYDMDPSSPGFLGLDWIAAGNGTGLPGAPADFTAPPGADEGFDGQHNASLFEGKLFLFDNTGTNGESRAARYNLDAGAGQVQLEEAWGVVSRCHIEGGAVPLPDGRVLATCATVRDIFLFEAGSADPVFELNATCGNPGGSPMNRGIPVVIE